MKAERRGAALLAVALVCCLVLILSNLSNLALLLHSEPADENDAGVVRVDLSAAAAAAIASKPAVEVVAVVPDTVSPVSSGAPSMQSTPVPLAPQDPKFELRHLERRNWDRALSVAQEQGFNIHGFYHVSTWKPRWREVIAEQLRIFDGQRYQAGDLDVQYSPGFSEQWTEPAFASVLKATKSLFVNVASSDGEDFVRVRDHILATNISDSNKAKFSFGFNYTVNRQSYEGMHPGRKEELMREAKYSEGEVSTMLQVQAFCKNEVAEGRRTIVFYAHSKGVCCYPRVSQNYGERASAAWRDMMMATVYEAPSICLRALLMGYPLCGSHKGNGHENGWYAGNFWWGVCGHIAAWPPMLTKNRFNAWWPEFVVMEAGRSDFPAELWRRKTWGEQCAYEVAVCKRGDGRYMDMYQEICPRSSYLSVMMQFSRRWELPHVSGSKMARDPGICNKIWAKGPYHLQPGYMNSTLYFD